jgi:methionyl-tRNA formyltransferase
MDDLPVTPLPGPPAHPRRLVFLGTPAMSVPVLRALHAERFDIALVVSRADTRRGRGGAMVPSPVKAAAVELGLPVTDRVEDALEVGADLGVVVAFGRIIRRPVLEQLPMINLHFSLLPRWRGAAPVERSLLAGDDHTGVDLMAVEEGLDTGGVHASAIVTIGEHETADELRARLVDEGTTMLIDALRAGLGEPVAQRGEATYASKIEPGELEIDWSAPAAHIDRLVRVGGAWTTFRGKRLKVWRARPDAPESGDGGGDGADGTLAPGELAGTRVGTGHGVLTLLEVQPEGKARQDVAAWRNGARPAAGEHLGDDDSRHA